MAEKNTDGSYVTDSPGSLEESLQSITLSVSFSVPWGQRRLAGLSRQVPFSLG